MYDIESVHLLSLIFMHTFDLDIKYGIRIDRYLFFFLNVFTKLQFLLPFYIFNFLKEFFICCKQFKFFKFEQFAKAALPTLRMAAGRWSSVRPEPENA